MAGFFREQIIKRLERSGRWPTVRKNWVKDNPICAVCGRKTDLQVHHIVPFNIDPSLELCRSNLITLCGRHHLTFGHLGYWKSYNPNVFQDCNSWFSKFLNRP
jgi:5-methylcytosine-specific restriction enzyme A